MGMAPIEGRVSGWPVLGRGKESPAKIKMQRNEVEQYLARYSIVYNLPKGHYSPLDIPTQIKSAMCKMISNG